MAGQWPQARRPIEAVVRNRGLDEQVRAVSGCQIRVGSRQRIDVRSHGGAACPDRWRSCWPLARDRSEEHTSELQSLMRISYAVFCLKKNKTHKINRICNTTTST